MEKKIMINNIEYILTNKEIYLPKVSLPGEKKLRTIGAYAEKRRRFLREHVPLVYTELLTSGTLAEHLADIEEECQCLLRLIVQRMAKEQGLTEEMKSQDLLGWAQKLNNIYATAREMVLTVLVYV